MSSVTKRGYFQYLLMAISPSLPSRVGKVFHFFSPFFKLGMVFSLALVGLGGCGTVWFIEETSGERVRYEFRVLDSDLPRPMIYWREWPRDTETALALEPDLPGCSDALFFVNQDPEPPVKLSQDLVEVKAILLESKEQERGYWVHMPSDRCAILITLEGKNGAGLTSISVSSRFDQILDLSEQSQENKPGSGAALFLLPFFMLGDVVFTPSRLLGEGMIASIPNPTEPVTVSFKFPDDSQQETNLTSDEVKQLLQKDYLHVLKQPHSMITARPWVRAALVKLNLEYREEGKDNQKWTEKILTLVGDYPGNWTFIFEHDGQTFHDHNLNSIIGGTSTIRFSNIGSTNTISFSRIDGESTVEVNLYDSEVLKLSHDEINMAIQEIKVRGFKGDEDPELLYQGYWGQQGQDRMKWLCRAVDLKYADAQYRLGELYEQGSEGLPTDIEKAYLWYMLGAAEDHYWSKVSAERLSTKLTLEQLKETERMISEWQPGQCEQQVAPR